MMHLKALLVFFVSVEVSWCLEDQIFPPTFKFGTASSSYQVEGAWNVSDKGESIWDRFTHNTPGAISDGSNGDVACDSYHLWRRDVEMAAELGIDFYRFSISWPRLLPTGFSNYISEDGKNYYNNLIDGLLENGIEPVITLYHWDLPQTIQDLGGWTNPLISDWFADYARVVYSLYGDRVKTWITINEPIVVCDVAYNTGIIAPGIVDPERAAYLCNKYLLIAHAKAWRIYDEIYRHLYHGEVSISNNLLWFEPFSDDDIEITELAMDYCLRYCYPIFSKDGGWPPKIEALIAEKSMKEGYTRSRLPAFTQEEIQLVKGTFDFYALNYYTSRLARKALPGDPVGAWPTSGLPEIGVVLENDPIWELGASDFYPVYPVALRRLLAFLKESYGDIGILITENGYGDDQSGLEDDRRVQYYKAYLEQVLLAIKNGVNVMGYTAWSLLDNFEWIYGYSTKFGLYEVNFTDPAHTRTARKSAHYYANVIKTRSFEPTK